MDVVILSGSIGKGAPWTLGCIKSLLPLPGRSTLFGSLIRALETNITGRCIVCTDGHKDQFVRQISELIPGHMKIEYFEDGPPLGTAGCLKACESRTEAQTILLVGGSVWLDDDPRWMLAKHLESGNALTVFCTNEPVQAALGSHRQLRPAGVFCCDRSVFEHIRPEGFQDLKEQLVPALRRAGLRVGAVPLCGTTCEISDHATYLNVISRILIEGRFHGDGFSRIAPDVWCGREAQIAPRARLVGPVLLGHNSKVDDGALIVGPAMLGDQSHIGRYARLVRIVAPQKLCIRPGMVLVDRVLVPGSLARTSSEPHHSAANAGGNANSSGPRALTKHQSLLSPVTAAATVLVAAFLWAFWPSITRLWNHLGANADYNAGQLVPVAALYMIASQRERWIPNVRFWWPGLAVFALGLTATVAGYSFQYSSIEYLGLVTAAIGVLASILGHRLRKRFWVPLLAFFMMVPLPHRLNGAILLSLQDWGAGIAVRVLESIGIPVVQAGSVLQVGGNQICVPESCSGLSMVLAFLIVAAVIACVSDRPVWQKAIVLFSSVPIALFCNIIRLVLSAYLISIGRQELAEAAFHDGAAMIMIPFAIVLVFLEFWLLSNLIVPKGGVSALVEVVDDRVQRSTSLSGS